MKPEALVDKVAEAREVDHGIVVIFETIHGTIGEIGKSGDRTDTKTTRQFFLNTKLRSHSGKSGSGHLVRSVWNGSMHSPTSRTQLRQKRDELKLIWMGL